MEVVGLTGVEIIWCRALCIAVGLRIVVNLGRLWWWCKRLDGRFVEFVSFRTGFSVCDVISKTTTARTTVQLTRLCRRRVSGLGVRLRRNSFRV